MPRVGASNYTVPARPLTWRRRHFCRRPPRGMRMNSHKHRSVHAAAFAGYRPSTVVTEVLTKPAFGPISPGSGHATLIAAIRVVDQAAHGWDLGRKIVPGVAEGIGQ